MFNLKNPMTAQCAFAAMGIAMVGIPQFACGQAPTPVRIGYFPNVTHAQAVLAGSPERADFQKALGDKAKVETSTFNAGPSLMEALFAGKVDVGYIGPSPIINGWVASRGQAFRVVAGSANNGIVIVGSKKLGITKLEQLKGARTATPQLGNTQDISAKHYITKTLGATLKERGGDTVVMPISNPDIEIAFEKDQVEAAWVPEPWGSRLIQNGLANLIVEEKDLWPNKRFTLTSVIVRQEFLEQHPDLLGQILDVHVRLTKELQAHPEKYADQLNRELKRLTAKELPAKVLTDSLSRIEFSLDALPDSFARFYEKGRDLQLVREISGLPLEQLVEPAPLKAAIERFATQPSAESSTTSSIPKP
jgi:NitT/TauT family transport system substrate-binding protein